MQVSVTFRHTEPTEALKSFASEKVAKIEKYFTAPTDAHVVLSVEKYMHQADITIKAHGVMMRGKEKSEDMYASIERAMSKIERQVRRYRDKLANHKPHEGQTAKIKLNILEAELRAAAEAEAAIQAAEEEKPSSRIAVTKEIDVRPMGLDDAVMQMDLLNNDFFVFINARTQGVNVLYRRPEGNLGLIEAPPSIVG